MYRVIVESLSNLIADIGLMLEPITQELLPIPNADHIRTFFGRYLPVTVCHDDMMDVIDPLIATLWEV